MNRGATVRSWRLSLVYVVGIAALFALLAVLARRAPGGGSAGTTLELELVGLLAVGIGALGVVVSLGAAPRAVLLSEDQTIVIGRFGRRYRFPGRGKVRTTVLQRFPANLFAPVPLESVEIGGGSSRRSFLIDEGLLGPVPEATARRN